MAITIQEQADLQALNGLGLRSIARYLVDIDSMEALREAAAFARSHRLPVIPVGEGSNLVPAADLDAVVLRLQLPGIQVDDNRVTVAGGENWHSLVAAMTGSGLYGLENLALIPGTAGAAPVQNIGAYGVELCDRFVGLRAYHLETDEVVAFNRDDCEFGYRDSIFKREKHWVITELVLQLTREDIPEVTYPGIAAWLDAEGMEANCEAVFDAVVSIRTDKLPDPHVLPNVGSFFKNPVVGEDVVENINRTDMPAFPQPGGQTKLSAAWLIDQAGLKGARCGGVCVSDQHALVLINLGGGTGSQLLELIDTVQRRVAEQFGVTLDVEPSVLT